MATTKQEEDIKQEEDDDNITLNGPVASRAATGIKVSPRPRRSFTNSLLNTITRLTVWYAIITIIFRCPGSSTELSDASPLLCAPYFQARAQIYPHVQPYYQKYLGPADEAVRPYAEKLHEIVYVPMSGYLKDGYEEYVVPQVAKARKFGEVEWDKNVRPYLDAATSATIQRYDGTLRPYVDQVSGTVYPYVSRASTLAHDQYYVTILPLYEKALPYGVEAYRGSRYVIIDVAYPYSRWAAETFVTVMRRRVWPTLRIIYGQNVEPQLAKIKERLGSYRDANRLEAEMASAGEAVTSLETSTSIAKTESEPSPSLSTNVGSGPEPATEPAPSAEASTAASTASTSSESPAPEESASPSGQLANDLAKWQRNFAKAAERGIEHLSSRVADITLRQIETQVDGVSNALVTKLTETSTQSTADLKVAINKIVANLADDASEDEVNEANSKVRSLVRSSGQSIKEKAQDLRSWKLNFIEETESLVRAAATSTLGVLDSIRDLGLQQIGLRWAAMESVDYKDWEEYHNLKKKFDEMRSEVEATAIGHAGVADAKKAAEDAEDRGMDIARDAAEELVRLREVATWKIQARDTTDDFTDRIIPASVEKARQKVMDGLNDASESILGTTQGLAESIISAASESAEELASEASSYVVDSISSAATRLTQPSADSITSRAKETIQSGTSLTDDIVDGVASASSKASAEASSLYSKLEEGSIKPGRHSGQIAQSILSDIKDSQREGSKILSEQASSAAESASSVVDDGTSSFTTIPPNVYATQDIVDELTDGVSASLQSVVEGAGERIEDVTESLQEEAARATAQSDR